MYDYRHISPEERRQVVEERRRAGLPLHAPPHFEEGAQWYLISAACYEHQPRLEGPELLSWFQQELLTELAAQGLSWAGWVILPNHYHFLGHTPGIAVLREAVRLLHSRTATELNRRDHARGRQVWYRFSDRRIRGERHYWTTLNYIHYNPVKHGYVTRLRHWPWSSVHDYVEQYGLEWLRDLWQTYPVRDYGRGWDW